LRLKANKKIMPSFSAKEHGASLLRPGRPLLVQKRGPGLRNAFRSVTLAKSPEIRSARFPEKGETACQENQAGNVELRGAESDLRRSRNRIHLRFVLVASFGQRTRYQQI